MTIRQLHPDLWKCVMASGVNGKQRTSISVGCTVDVIRKEDQRTGRKTRGVVQEILTNSATHPHGIKVRLKDGTVGRVADIMRDCNPGT